MKSKVQQLKYYFNVLVFFHYSTRLQVGLKHLFLVSFLESGDPLFYFSLGLIDGNMVF